MPTSNEFDLQFIELGALTVICGLATILCLYVAYSALYVDGVKIIAELKKHAWKKKHALPLDK